jgi:hypothetical protein
MRHFATAIHCSAELLKYIDELALLTRVKSTNVHHRNADLEAPISLFFPPILPNGISNTIRSRLQKNQQAEHSQARLSTMDISTLDMRVPTFVHWR